MLVFWQHITNLVRKTNAERIMPRIRLLSKSIENKGSFPHTKCEQQYVQWRFTRIVNSSYMHFNTLQLYKCTTGTKWVCEAPYPVGSFGGSQGQGHREVNVEVVCTFLTLMNMHTKYQHCRLHRSKVTGKNKVCRQTCKQTHLKQIILQG